MKFFSARSLVLGAIVATSLACFAGCAAPTGTGEAEEQVSQAAEVPTVPASAGASAVPTATVVKNGRTVVWDLRLGGMQPEELRTPGSYQHMNDAQLVDVNGLEFYMQMGDDQFLDKSWHRHA